MKNSFIVFAILSIFSLQAFLLNASAQNTEWKDTLKAAVKIDDRIVVRSINRVEASKEAIRNVISPMGEGDPIRWAQALPGVTTGADGSSAFYVRGGNIGNNLFSLDGVPVYGYSHILGLATIVPDAIVGNVSFSKGGFDGRYGNFTASHLDILTKTPETEKFRTELSLNNFLSGVNLEAPVRDNMSILVSGRISPLSLEYKAVNGMMADGIGGLRDFGASVADVYAKFHWKISQSRYLSASTLLSIDSYKFKTKKDADDLLQWKNALGIVKYHYDYESGFAEVTGSINYFDTRQKQDRIFHGLPNSLSLESELEEAMLSFDGEKRIGQNFALNLGAKLRYAQFSPGQVAAVKNNVDVLLGSAYVQAQYELKDRLLLRASARENGMFRGGGDYSTFNPDLSLYFKANLTPELAVSGSVDRIHQYYHTLEGMPVGWSLDMIVPSGDSIAPEKVFQGDLGISLSVGKHHLTVGGFYKKMDDLVYYKYAKSLFNGALAAWEENVSVGSGKSYGGEFLYEYRGDELYARLSYTLSKTTREGFEGINDGKPFNAKFDRRHVLNSEVRWKHFDAAFILQSGHWENGAPKVATVHFMDYDWPISHYEGVNNYHMPMVIRLDLGYGLEFDSPHAHHNLHLGICNVFNHFNPFMIYYDSDTDSWKQLSMLPLLPNFSYRISF